ncbi:MAG: site-2 protease family protein [Solirubrobacteraceae bacterium]
MLRRGTSIQLARILGIRIGVDVSWFVVLFIFIFLLSGQFRDVLNSSDGVAYLTAVSSALLFFFSLILHELGHAVAARREGIGIESIDLWFFGGIARMSRDTDSPGAEFRVAIAGPLVTVAVVAVCLAIGVATVGWPEFWDAVVLTQGANVTPALLLLSWLALINAVLFVFNMIPAFPLDGGRVARAVAWRVTGDRNRGTRFAATLGQGFAYILIGWGIFRLITGDLAGLYTAVLGWFLLQAARGAVVQTAFSERIEGVTVADIMDREPVTIPAELPLLRAEDEYFMRYRWPWFGVVDGYGRYLGVVHQDRVAGAVGAGHGHLTVSSVLDQDLGETRVSEDEPLEALLGSEPLSRLGAVFAVDRDGVLRGVVTLEQLRRALQQTTVVPQ